MRAFKALVRQGRLVIDVPTDLPEGAEIDLVPADMDALSPEDQACLIRTMEREMKDLERRYAELGESPSRFETAQGSSGAREQRK